MAGYYRIFFTAGHGFKLSPVSGQILCQLAVGQTPKYDMKPFKITRFAAGEHMFKAAIWFCYAIVPNSIVLQQRSDQEHLYLCLNLLITPFTAYVTDWSFFKETHTWDRPETHVFLVGEIHKFQGNPQISNYESTRFQGNLWMSRPNIHKFR